MTKLHKVNQPFGFNEHMSMFTFDVSAVCKHFVSAIILGKISSGLLSVVLALFSGSILFPPRLTPCNDFGIV